MFGCANAGGENGLPRGGAPAAPAFPHAA